MSKQFNQVSMNKPKRSAFDLGHERKFSMNFGDLTPIMCQEVVPGDTFKNNTEVMVRMAPMLAPIMHRVNVFTHFFFVPNRLVWSEWEDFITGGESGQSSPVFPVLRTNSAQPTYFANGKLADYLGMPTASSSSGEAFDVNALPFRAYQTIYNEYYRDQNLQDKVTVNKTSGIISLGMDEFDSIQTMRTRCYEKDYFTSALPWTQRGGDVLLPMSGDAPVVPSGSLDTAKLKNATTGADVSGDVTSVTGLMKVGTEYGIIDPNGSLVADMSSVSAATIEELRRAVKLQSWLERNARGGSRYIEQVLSHFGVRSSDARLQRPEYLGGGRTPLVISEVLQTSASDATSDQGNMAGHAIAVGNSHTFKKFFEEHGFVIGIMSVVPKTSYQQGIPKMFRKFDKFDYYWPEFAQLGEQPVLNQEIYCDFKETTSDQVFGYQSRYAEYKYIPSTVHGDFRDTLSFWHMGRIFSALPALNEDFVKVDVDERNFPVQDGSNKMYVQVFNNLKAIRPIPFYNQPNIL